VVPRFFHRISGKQYNPISRNRFSPWIGLGTNNVNLDEERGIPFIQRTFETFGRSRASSLESIQGDRGFNNPNIQLSIVFKPKVKNNNYEFIVAIEPKELLPNNGEEEPRQKVLKKYKVKRNLYEFMELFNYLESKNPRDRFLREFDYNRMFGS
jgi:hypothetical protein